jgi:carbonic anhydrase/acetyltransferase-like protein (isoleucine patch superfamily)
MLAAGGRPRPPGASIPTGRRRASSRCDDQGGVMQQLENLLKRIIQRVDINLRRIKFDAAARLNDLVPLQQLNKFYAFYGITHHHPLHYHFNYSNLGGTYLVGRCKVDNSVLYKSDIRGDELKNRGEVFLHDGKGIALDHDEFILIKDSFLIKTLVHNCSHDPENPEIFLIKNTAALPYANIHGSVTEGCFLGPFSTVDLTSLHGCSIGAFAYVQVGELWHKEVPDGRIWVRSEGNFDFSYRFPRNVLKKYIRLSPGAFPQGILMEFVEGRKPDFERVFNVVHLNTPASVPQSTSLSRFAVVKPKTRIGQNVLVAQRAYLENSTLGKGANAQEHCYIIDSTLDGYNVTAHGAKLISAHLEKGVFVGFNAFLRGSARNPLEIGKSCVVMPHTLIDLKEPVAIPPQRLVWGLIRTARDLDTQTLALSDLKKVSGRLDLGAMRFQGSGAAFVKAFQHRIDHILEANGAYFDGKTKQGHAQRVQDIAYNILQPYPLGSKKGMYPAIDIHS